MERYETECHNVPFFENPLLEPHVGALATLQLAARVAFCANGRFDVWREVPAALQEVLNSQASSNTEVARPLSVDFALEVESALFVRKVAGDHEKTERNPETECVHGEERAVVEKDPSPADESGKETRRSSNSRRCFK